MSVLENQENLEISELYQTLIETLDEKIFFKELCKVIKSNLSCDVIKANIFISDKEVSLAYSNKGHSKIGQTFESVGITSHVFRSKRAYFSNSISRDPVFMETVDSGILAELCLPILVDGEILGTIHLQRKSVDEEFSKADITTIESVLNSLERPISNLKIFLTAKSLNDSLLKKIQEKEQEIQKKSIEVIDENLMIDEPELIGQSESFLSVVELAEKISLQNVNVLLTGEAGTGKELIAKKIHTSSKSKDKAFGVVDCSSLNQIEISEYLFGDGSSKNGMIDRVGSGTILLKRVDCLSLGLQSRLLPFLKSRNSKKIRFISSTTIDLKEKVDRGEFREDLFYCLNTIELNIPSLRDRKEDIELLVNHYLNTGKEVSLQKSFSPGALRCLIDYNWPGNLLELQSVVERAYILADLMIVEKIHLSDAVRIKSSEIVDEAEDQNYQFVEMPLGELEKFHICQTLDHLGGNKTKTAKVLGITVKTLYNKLHSYGMIGEKEV